MCLRVCLHYRLVVQPANVQLPVRQPSDKLVEEMATHILELQKKVQYLKAELLRVTGEPRGAVRPKFPIWQKSCKPWPKGLKTSRGRKNWNDRNWLNSVRKAKSSKDWRKSGKNRRNPEAKKKSSLSTAAKKDATPSRTKSPLRKYTLECWLFHM